MVIYRLFEDKINILLKQDVQNMFCYFYHNNLQRKKIVNTIID